MAGALCFGAFFGIPLMLWGGIVIVDRKRAWRMRREKSREALPPRPPPGWERRQIMLGSCLIALGAVIMAALAAFNFWAQGTSPPAPF